MGKPVLGEHSKLEVIIEESYEFKVGKYSLVIRTEGVLRAVKQIHSLPQRPPCLKERLHLSNFSISGGDVIHRHPPPNIHRHCLFLVCGSLQTEGF